MFIIHGAYHFWPKRVAFRNDYCLSCREPRRSIAVRTFDVGHISWIPVLPVGFWKHWQCTVCGEQPHLKPKTRRSLKWGSLVTLIACGVLIWAAPITPEDAEEVASVWILRVGAPLAAMLLVRHLLLTPKHPSLREMLKTVPPATDTVCHFCGTPLVMGARSSCPACGAVRC
jgi:hypothetical protein